MVLNSQRGVYDRASLSYKPKNKQKFLTNFFTASSSVGSTSHITCSSYGRVRHKAYICNTKKFNRKIIKKIWIPKATMTANPKKPKKT